MASADDNAGVLSHAGDLVKARQLRGRLVNSRIWPRSSVEQGRELQRVRGRSDAVVCTFPDGRDERPLEVEAEEAGTEPGLVGIFTQLLHLEQRVGCARADAGQERRRTAIKMETQGSSSRGGVRTKRPAATAVNVYIDKTGEHGRPLRAGSYISRGRPAVVRAHVGDHAVFNEDRSPQGPVSHP